MELTNADIKYIKKTLENVGKREKKYISKGNDIVKKYGADSKEVKEYLEYFKKINAINLEIVNDIINKYGWLSAEKIGFLANQAMFIVIQHAPLNIQETFYPKMKEALQSGNLRPQDFALFVDKLAINKGEKQIYGTQVKFDDEIN